MEGLLWKKKKNDFRFQQKKFVLLQNEGILKYYGKEVSIFVILYEFLIIINFF